MPRDFEFKKREIRKSLNRRSRLRKAYFKMTEGTVKPPKNLEVGEIDLSQPDSEEEGAKPSKKRHGKHKKHQKESETSTWLPEKQYLAQQRERRRQEEEARELALARRKMATKKAMARNSKGQPKLGAQMGLLLDKLQKK